VQFSVIIKTVNTASVVCENQSINVVFETAQDNWAQTLLLWMLSSIVCDDKSTTVVFDAVENRWTRLWIRPQLCENQSLHVVFDAVKDHWARLWIRLQLCENRTNVKDLWRRSMRWWYPPFIEHGTKPLPLFFLVWTHWCLLYTFFYQCWLLHIVTASIPIYSIQVYTFPEFLPAFGENLSSVRIFPFEQLERGEVKKQQEKWNNFFRKIYRVDKAWPLLFKQLLFRNFYSTGSAIWLN
jgi:hypothetical protein